ncbi:hypothetical protein [Synechocystis salina]|uniref:Uncharacterized protein n=1 Tax=Synechocystis salina LEGE 00031 TaxID=1828736 RepID=A0ABR9VWE1_9SYNC|nr:hypothetical protein [Synechocystis salina]MBE9242685.1 hypothetical protein [Synechocystis salina LEGE 00041]MBE9255690.1 hypothetical protein [Synechocystis salina LEGE 00031]
METTPPNSEDIMGQLETLSTTEKLKILNSLRAHHGLPPMTMGEALLGAGLSKEEREILLSVCP